MLVGHDWGANAGFGVVVRRSQRVRPFVALAAPRSPRLATAIFAYRQLKRSFYIWFIQQVGLAEAALIKPGFWESLWADWSPGYDPRDDIAELRRYVTADNIADVICPYRASFNPPVRRSPMRQSKEAPRCNSRRCRRYICTAPRRSDRRRFTR